MCGRYVLKAPRAELIARFALDECEDFPPHYNIAPSTDIPTIIVSHEGKRVLRLMHWGLIPSWAKDDTMGRRLINARGESLATRPAFRAAFQRHRCLIPASGFYEWRQEGRFKQPYYISLRSGEPMAFAGLWETWKTPDGTKLRSTCIITTDANKLMHAIHDRMPAIIESGDWRDWLAGPPSDTASLVRPYQPDDLQMWKVGRTVNKATEEGPSLIEPI